MPFDCQPIAEVEKFIEKHYKGGSVIDFGCGAGRYAHCFPKEDYLGVDGSEINIQNLEARGYKGEVHNLETWKPKKKFDYLFSSVVFDQLTNLPKDWANTYILIEPEKYVAEFKPEVCETLEVAPTVRMMVCKTHLK
jgi:trans-aconitate methyltransferase